MVRPTVCLLVVGWLPAAASGLSAQRNQVNGHGLLRHHAINERSIPPRLKSLSVLATDDRRLVVRYPNFYRSRDLFANLQIEINRSQMAFAVDMGKVAGLPRSASEPQALYFTPAQSGPSDKSKPAFPGNRSQWNGYSRYDFQLAARMVTVVVPRMAARGRPWVWRGEFFGAYAYVDEALLRKGWHIVYMACPDTFGNPDTMQRWAQLYEELTANRGLSRRPVLLGMSRGGLYVYNWAAAHPDKVGLIYGDAPVCDVKSWPGGKGKGKGSPRDWDLFKKVYGLTEQEALDWKHNPIDILAPIAAAHIPILHVVGDADESVPYDENTLVLKSRYEALGGHVELIVKHGVGHHPHSLENPTPIVKYILKHRLKD